MSVQALVADPQTIAAARPLGPADGPVRSLAREILAKNEYARWRPQNAWAELLARFERWTEGWMDALREWLPDWVVVLIEAFLALFDRLGLAPDDPADLTLLEWVIGALLLALVVFVIFGLIGSLWRRRNTLAGENDAAGPGSGAPLPLEAARTLASDGHFLAAAHHVQLAALQLLLEGRFVELSRSEPNATLRARLARSGLPEAERGDFLALLDRLEGHWFRDRTEDRELYRDWCQLHTRLDALGKQP